MDPLKLDLAWRANSPDPETWTLIDDTGSPVDLSGYTFAMDVRAYPGAPDPAILSLGMAGDASSPGFWLVNASQGQFSVTPPAKATLEALRPAAGSPVAIRGYQKFAFDIVLIHPDAVRESFVYGHLTLYSGVTA